MKKVFKVAGHKFGIDIPDNDLAWKEMAPYQPFLTEEEGDCLFCMELVHQLPEIKEKKRIFVDCSSTDQPRIELYDTNDAWLFDMAPTLEAPIRASMITDKSFTLAKVKILGSMRFSLHSAVMLMFAFSSVQLDTLLMHASVTMNNGKGYLFLGKSGTGKSTHSQLWINNIEGCSLLNDDNPILRVNPDGQVRVYGSPWSGKTPCYRNLDVPVGAIVSLRQAKENKIRKLSLVESYAALYASYSGIKFIQRMAGGLHTANEKVISTVPCYLLDCLPNAEAAYLCYKTIAH